MSRRKREDGASISSDRVYVDDGDDRRPFMRGIMVHALMTRGIDFEDALKTADAVRSRIRGRGIVSRVELDELVAELLGQESVGDHQPPLAVRAQVDVGTAERSRPFSKGVLSQSLLAAAIDPDAAFAAAREIELELARRGLERIERSELRKIAYETLLDRFGRQTAERYLAWREHESPDKPVIVLLGGTTGAGKTSIALEVALRLGIRRVLSTDSIRHIMRITLSPELMPALHTSSFEAYQQVNPDPESDSEPVIDGFMAQAQVVSVGVRAMLDRAVEENTSLVLDGVALVPGLLDLDHYTEAAHVIPMLVARLDENAFRQHFEARAGEHGHRGTERYLRNLNAILRIQDQLVDLADRYRVPIVDNLSVESSVMLVIRHVVETLRRRSVPQPLD